MVCGIWLPDSEARSDSNMMEDKDNNMRTRGTNGRSLSDLPPRVYIHDCHRAFPELSCHDCTSQALFRAHMGNLGIQLNTC